MRPSNLFVILSCLLLCAFSEQNPSFQFEGWTLDLGHGFVSWKYVNAGLHLDEDGNGAAFFSDPYSQIITLSLLRSYKAVGSWNLIAARADDGLSKIVCNTTLPWQPFINSEETSLGYSFLSLNSHFSPSDDEKIIAQAFSSPGFLQYENVNLFYGPSHTSPKELKAVYLKGERQGNLDKWVYVTDTSFPPSWLTEKEPLTSFGCSRE